MQGMKRQHENQLSTRFYREELEGVEIQFALIRFALGKLSKSSIQDFFKVRLNQRLDRISAGFEVNKEQSKDDTEKWAEIEKTVIDHVKKKHRKDSRPSDARFKIELSEDRLNQSELLLLVAHFESFMKDVHRTFLTAAPAKVFSKRETKFILREAIEDQPYDPFGKFLKELIIKEVKSLDAQRIERRAEYFAEHFGISFGSREDIEGLKERLCGMMCG
jgi:hypothetical protein